ncbi:hypothetical protein SUGI_0351220 [Cryptomeria japonica]|nr:hypothetical protein SUGI_0351220 [Cryptomeria japonica]
MKRHLSCYPGSLEAEKAKGKIVVCSDGYFISKRIKKAAVQSSQGRGMIVVDDLGRSVASNYDTFLSFAVSSEDGDEILSYRKSIKYSSAL